jgi:hypothetical protein
MASRLFLSFFVALLLISGCVENRASFYVQDMKVPTDECVIPADRDATYYSWGTWDVGLSGSYQVHPLVVNEMSSSLNLNPTGAESNTIQVEGAWVSLLDSGDTELVEESFVYSPCTVFPEGGATAMNFKALDLDTYDTLAGFYPGSLVSSLTLCDPRLGGTLSTIVIRIRVVGMTTGNKEVETPYFFFPLTVCCGCTVYFPADAFDEIEGVHDCISDEGGETDPPCFLGQDKNVDCRICAGNAPALCSPTDDYFANPWYYISN